MKTKLKTTDEVAKEVRQIIIFPYLYPFTPSWEVVSVRYSPSHLTLWLQEKAYIFMRIMST